MSNFGRSCLGGMGNCVDYENSHHYDNGTYAREGVAPRGNSGVSVYFEDVNSPGESSTSYCSNEPLHYQEAYMSDQPPVSTSHHTGAISFAGDGENQCQCEYLMFDNFKWVKQRHYVVAKDGREYFDRYVVTFRKRDSNVEYDMFTYAEGMVHNGQIEDKFKHLCGEVLALHDMPPVNSLKNICYFTPPSIDPNAPFHIQEEVCKTKSLNATPLKIDTDHQVLVVRTFNNTLAIQLMPTAYSERTILSGTPLFQGVKKNICGMVGNMFSEFYYVINGTPCLYTLFSIGPKEKGDQTEGDRMRVVMLDRRDRVDSEEWSANESVMNSVSDVANVALQRAFGKDARLDVRDILYVGVVNNKMQLTDAPTITKKYKPPKSAIVVIIDNRGVYATQIRDKEIVSQWVQKDANVIYSLYPRNFFDKPRSSVLRINTADTNAKLKRAKSKEMLI